MLPVSKFGPAIFPAWRTCRFREQAMRVITAREEFHPVDVSRDEVHALVLACIAAGAHDDTASRMDGVDAMTDRSSNWRWLSAASARHGSSSRSWTACHEIWRSSQP